ncbi:MAG TPA: hypothetical protein VN873_11055 [Candidatus Angelobacter sp.]|nr:hypothetical protein [Candidatus Angelobacter sp.]
MNTAEYAIKCPMCSAKAVAIMKAVGIEGTYREPVRKMGVHRLVCESCGLSKEVADDDTDAYELWYAAVFRGHRLWARNREHLSLLISWLSGDLRKEDVRFAGDTEDKYFGARVVVESLPKWMVLAKNRAGVLKCLRKLYNK